MFVGTDTVWKLKRAVRLSFLDFTDLETRRRMLERELAVNRDAAPGLYRDVVAVTRGPEGPVIGGTGPVLDWVLRMAPVPEGDFLLPRVARGLDGAMLDALGDMVAADHAARPPAAAHDIGDSGRNARANAQAARQAGLPAADVAAWLAAAEAALAAVRPALQARADAGFVRRAHGDLHLGNICVWGGKPTPFDAIEFDEAMATIDTGYDLAFLLMDLDRRAGRAAANRVLHRYVARTGDVGLLPLLPAFLSRRAMVRAHAGQEPALLDRAREYLRPAGGGVVAIGGLPGTGKSTLARALAPLFGAAPGALVLRSDEIRKRLQGVPPEARLPPGSYDAGANARTEAALLAAVRAAAAHGAVADATFLSPGLRAAVAGCGAPFVGIWLQAPPEVLAARLRARTGDASDATEAVMRRLAALDPGPIGWHVVPADERAVERCREALRAGGLLDG